jgi:CheY-like chemotaxis protein
MPDDLSDILIAHRPAAGRPFAGMTVLVVEDSRFACEAIRLLCLRSGARIRRADCLRAAHRHLATYRPSVVVVDVGLPDGSGLDLIASLAADPMRVPAIIGMSGDADAAARALARGADGFLVKPVESLAAFQSAVLGALAVKAEPIEGRTLPDETVLPDPIALRDDLSHAAEVLGTAAAIETMDPGAIDYVARFVAGIARSARDGALERAAGAVIDAHRTGGDLSGGVTALRGLMRARIASGAAF